MCTCYVEPSVLGKQNVTQTTQAQQGGGAMHLKGSPPPPLRTYRPDVLKSMGKSGSTAPSWVTGHTPLHMLNGPDEKGWCYVHGVCLMWVQSSSHYLFFSAVVSCVIQLGVLCVQNVHRCSNVGKWWAISVMDRLRRKHGVTIRNLIRRNWFYVVARGFL